MKVEVPDMMCENCVKRIGNAMEEAGIPVEISLETKSIEVSEHDLDKAKEILSDIGF